MPQIHVSLPVSDKAYQSSTKEPAITLCQTALGSANVLSPLSAAAVVYSLCSSTLKDLHSLDSTSVQKLFATNDWMQRNSLCNSLTTVFCVPPYLAVTKDNLDTNLLYLNVIIHSATLQVHRAVQKIARTSTSPQAERFINESNTQCLKAASSIFELARLASQSKIRNVGDLNSPQGTTNTNHDKVPPRHVLLFLQRAGCFCRLLSR